MYDAWTAYNPVAVGSVTGALIKGQGGSDNEANKREAISQAAFTVLRTLAPQRKRALLVCEEDFASVKACEGHSCTLVFADYTRKRARRWCSMAICGNRAKQAVHRHRLKNKH
jgi:predicted RNA-binding Zn ribbon-like protein